MPRGKQVDENVYLLPTGKFYWRLERTYTGERHSVDGTEPTLEGARMQRDSMAMYFRRHGYLPGDDRLLSLTVQQAIEGHLDAMLKVAEVADTGRSHVKGVLRPTTIGMRRACARRYVYPVIGDVKVLDLAPAHVQEMIVHMAGRGINPIAQSHMRTLLHNAVRHFHSVGRGVIAMNLRA